MSINVNPKRLPTETWDEYKLRRKGENNAIDNYINKSIVKVIKNRNVLDLPSVFLRTLQFTYEPEKLTHEQIKEMFNSISAWINHAQSSYYERQFLRKVVNWLERNDRGEFEARKRLYKEKGIDWRKKHRIPMAYDEKDVLASKLAMDEYFKKNPEMA